MGRAYEVRKASIQKTGAAKAKIYSMYAREIYAAAKNGGTEVDSNIALKRLIEKAKKDQVPSDIIKRAIDKVNSGIDESYIKVCYEVFGPSGSTLMIDCLTDNVNRTISNVRTALNKTTGKMGVSGSASFMYDHLAVLSFKGLSEEDVIEVFIDNNLEMDDIEIENNLVTVYGKPQELYQMKDALLSKNKDLIFETEEILYISKEKVKISANDFEDFKKLLFLLDEIEDVQNVYHNVEV